MTNMMDRQATRVEGRPGFSRHRPAGMVMMHRMILALGLSIVAVGCTLGKADDGPWMP